MAEFNVPLYQRMLQPSFRGLRALMEERELERSWKDYAWDRAREKSTGLTTYDRDLAYNGLTLYVSSGVPTTAQLISMTGDVVHKWYLPFRDVWPDQTHIKKAVPEDRIFWHTVRLFPNGDLIADYVAVGGSPYGYGLVRMDKDSQVIWRFSECAHHDFDVDATGKVYALCHAIKRDSVDGAPHLSTPALQDFVVVLSPEGKEQQRIAVFEAFARSKDFRRFLDSIKSDKRGDHTHCNGIDVITEAFAAKHGFCAAGDVMISVRNPGMLAILNLQRQEIVWASRGIWEMQHDCDPLENGNVLLFDNRGSNGDGGRSRILEWNPFNGAIEFSYSGTAERPFESLSRGCQQLLPNGNVLITEANNGRLFEVTRDQQIVWEFNNPERAGDHREFVAVVCSAARFGPEELTFLNTPSTARSSDPPLKTAQGTDNSVAR